jgi:hypothetical protein
MIAPHSSERSTFDLSNRFEALTTQGTKEKLENAALTRKGTMIYSH